MRGNGLIYINDNTSNKQTHRDSRSITCSGIQTAAGKKVITRYSSFDKFSHEITMHWNAEAALSGSDAVCNYTIQEDLWNAEMDKSHIARDIHNLVTNARQAMLEGGIIEGMARNEHEFFRAPSRIKRTGKYEGRDG